MTSSLYLTFAAAEWAEPYAHLVYCQISLCCQRKPTKKELEWNSIEKPVFFHSSSRWGETSLWNLVQDVSVRMFLNLDF